jgi:hypothetical protein
MSYIKLPLGVTNFKHLKDNCMFYADKTFAINALISETPPHILMHRPTGWGKSLLLSKIQGTLGYKMNVNIRLP